LFGPNPPSERRLKLVGDLGRFEPEFKGVPLGAHSPLFGKAIRAHAFPTPELHFELPLTPGSPIFQNINRAKC